MKWLESVVTAEPAEEPISIEDARLQIQVALDDDSFDTELDAYIKAARQLVEARTGTKLVTQTVMLRASCFAASIDLPIGPVQSITSIAYLDSSGVEQMADPALYEGVLVGLGPQVRLKPQQAWPGIYGASDAVRITVIAGYGAAAAVPDPLKQAIRLLVGQWFRDREDTQVGAAAPISNGVRALIDGYRRRRGL